MSKSPTISVSCVTALIAAGWLIAAGELRAQAPAHADAAQVATASPPEFDVVSVKTHKDEGMMMRIGFRPTADGFEADGVPLQLLLRQAFDLSEDRILSEPDWTKSARFDISAKVAPEDAPKLKALSMQQRFAMLLPVLQDRFGLKFHHETKDLQVYTLVVAKGGPKLKEAAEVEGSAAASQPATKAAGGSGDALAPPPPSGPDGKSGGQVTGKAGADGRGMPRGGTTMRMSSQGMTMEGHGTPIASLAQMISNQVSATVVDKTGLAGKYDFTLSFMPDNFTMNGQMMRGPSGGPSPDGAQSQEPVGPSIFSAVQEQLGLKLVAEKQAVDVVVIDHIEQPSAN